ncbi:MAG: metallopeptidase TldD-related protein [Sulfolobaceae archaeon]|nr:metallopeptidase TldD-related protein [Sulfolobaceae archaeon]
MSGIDIYNILDRAKNLGYSAEIYYIKLKEKDIEEDVQISRKSSYEEGYGLRIVKDCKLGFSYSNTLSYDLLDNAIEVYKSVEEKDCNYQIPSPEGGVNFLKEIHLLEFNEITEKIEEFYSQIKAYKNELSSSDVNITYYNVSGFEVQIGVANTEGIDINELKSGISLSLMANSKIKEGIVTPDIYEYDYTTNPSEINLDTFVNKIKENVNRLKKRYTDSIDRGIDIIFTQKALNELFMPLFSRAVSVENVFRNKSPFSKNKRISNEKLTVIDNPRYKYSLSSRSFDAEGLPTQETKILEKGEFTNFLSNTYWANKAKVKNTHSAIRTYLTLPTISTTTVELKMKDMEDPFYDKVLVVDEVQGVNTANFDTGDFSVNVSLGWLYHRKEEFGIYNMVLSGNIIDILNGITVMGNDVKRYGNIAAGMIRVKGLKIV